MITNAESLFAILFAIFSNVAEEPKIETPPAPKAVPVSCQLEIDDSQSRQVLVATVVGGDAKWSGEFRLSVESRGTNSMKIRQGGEIQLGVRETAHVARIGMGGSAGDAIDATMQLSGEMGSVECDIEEQRSRI